MSHTDIGFWVGLFMVLVGFAFTVAGILGIFWAGSKMVVDIPSVVGGFVDWWYGLPLLKQAVYSTGIGVLLFVWGILVWMPFSEVTEE